MYILVCLLLFILGIHNESLQLFSVSKSSISVVNPSGSVRGGTIIYIKGLGFSASANNNKIFVGPYPCIIPADGATETTLACETSDTNQDNSIFNLPIIVISNNQKQILKNPQGSFSYLNTSTPLITDIVPGSGIAGTFLKFYGLHRIKNVGNGQRQMGDVISMLIGDTQCGRFELDHGVIYPDFQSIITCNQSLVQQAGKYTVKQHFTLGYSTSSFHLNRYSPVNEVYHYAVLPSVNNIYPNSGSVEGQQLTINGTGFSTNRSKISVSVDGNNCEVVLSSSNLIKCNLGKKDINKTSNLATNVVPQMNGYFQGAGLHYKRYDISKLTAWSIDNFRRAYKTNFPSLTLLQQGYRSQIQTVRQNTQYQGQVYYGYFTAPTSGQYHFRGISNKEFAVYLSNQTYGSITDLKTPFIYSGLQQNINNFYANYQLTAEGKITLEKGKSYYIEAYYLNSNRIGRFKVFVQVPKYNAIIGQTFAVHQLNLTFTNDPEIIQFNQTGGTAGKINLTNKFKQIGLPQTVQSAVINYNATAYEFLYALYTFRSFYFYFKPSVVLTIYDNNGQVTTDPTKAYTYIWRVTIDRLRSPDVAAKIEPIFLNYTGIQYFKQTNVQNHGPSISGSFRIKIDKIDLKINGNNFVPYNAGALQLQSAFRALPGFQNVQVQLLSDYWNADQGSVWLITYYGCNFAINIQIDGTNLFGGSASTKPSVLLTQYRPYRPTLLVDPVDFNFLNIPSSKINVLVTVNDMPSICTGDCSYSFITNLPILTSASISNSVLTLSLTDPTLIKFSISDVTVTLNKQACTIMNGSIAISNFQCQLPKNSDSTPILTAGTFYPVVTVKQVGQASVSPSLTAFNFPLTLTSLNATSGPSFGGYRILLQGKGFPLDITNLTVTICNKNAIIETISNINALIIVPSCNTLGPQNIFISDGKHTSNNLTFTYISSPSPAFIYSVSPQSFNPSLKGIIQIFGSGFGTKISAVRVDLANSSGKIYQMRVLQINDTYIKAGIPGGLPGNFKVEVNIIGVGEASPNTTNANSFTYELVIQSVTPNAGSYNGGTLINIKGINFSPVLEETLVFVGNEINWLCTVEQLNSTNILCRTPPFNEYYNISQPQPVVLTNRLMVDSTCQIGSNCSFTYKSQELSPQLTSISTDTISTGTVILNGINLNLGTPQVILTNINTGLVTKVIPTAYSAVSLTFTVPNVESSSYQVKVRNDPIGESNSYLLNIDATIKSISPSSKISANGATVVLTGTGLPTTWPNPFFSLKISLVFESFIQLIARSISSTSFQIDLPAKNVITTFYIYITTPLGTILTANFSNDYQFTPFVNLTTFFPSTAGLIKFNFTQLNFQNEAPSKIKIYSIYNSEQIYTVINSTHTTGLISFTYTLTAGKYGFKFYFVSSGWATCLSTISLTMTAPTIPAITTSYNGGVVALTGVGISKSGTIKVNGFKTRLQKVTQTGAEAIIPPFVNALTQQLYRLSEPSNLRVDQYTIISDFSAVQALAFDGFHGSVYTSNSKSTCFIGVNVGSDALLNLTRIRFFPNSKWMIVSNYLIGSRFEASLDGVTWINIGNIDSNVHSGWNIMSLKVPVSYRQFRFIHDTTSNCQLAEIEFQGIIQSSNNPVSPVSNIASVTYEDGSNTFTLSNNIEYREDHTPVVKNLSKTRGDVFGNYTLSLYGINLNFSTPTVLIDGVPCTVTYSIASQINCTVGSRLALPFFNSFIVKVGNANAIIFQIFSYVMRWSDIRTWGTDLFPVDGDLVFVPAGMNLLVDQSTPVLKGILVQNGTLTFADQTNMIVSAGIITVVGGNFIAGTENYPYQHQLTFVMYGDYQGPQQPMFGNKGIGCLECFISIYGQVRQYTWTSLETTALAGSNFIIVQDPVDWKIGEQIAIASTSHNHSESEDRIITAINGKNITVDRPFIYQHFAGIQKYSSTDELQMRAEVGLLTRNIKIKGEPNSASARHGSHLMMTGSAQNGFKGHIAYTEFTDCGQPKIIGRYCIHFHMNGDLSDSFALGNAVHHSMARVITLHGVHFLTVKDNVGYRVEGHNYFIEDGIETNNLIEHNLAISSIQAWTMLQTDITVSSFWITHPSNHFRYNHAAGGDFYGFWYEVKTRPEGPSACADVCPIGNGLGESRNNVAHSNKRFGLRIFKLSPRTYPCSDLFIKDEVDPWQYNPGVIGIFSNYTLYKNGEAGLLAEETGNLVFINITSAENLQAGVEFYVVGFTKDLTSFKNSVIIGQTKTNSPVSIKGANGIITPRLGNIRIDNIRFYNFPNDTNIMQTCSKCDQILLFTNTAQQIFISNISYTNVSGSKLFMNGLKRQIIYDLDGTFTSNSFDGQPRRSATLVANYKHLNSDPACFSTTNTKIWDSTIVCNEFIKLVKVTMNNMITLGQMCSGFRVQQIQSISSLVSANSNQYTEIYSYFPGSPNIEPEVSAQYTFALPYITGRIYNIWCLKGQDFSRFTMSSSMALNSTDAAIRFKFNYTFNRQIYEVTPVRPNTTSNLFINKKAQLNQSTCNNGQYYHDNSINKHIFQICASGKNKTYFQTTEVKAINCQTNCGIPDGEFLKQNFVRFWSNASQWPNGVLPKEGDNVTVNGNWTIIMDIDPARCEFMQIDGDVIIEDKADRNIQCDTIWIRPKGSLKAGSYSAPFTHKLNIQLNGLKNSSGYTFSDQLSGSKIFVVTGVLSLYGVSPATVSAKLLATAYMGSSAITVQNTTGWKVGDEIVISPTFSLSRQYERVKIQSISGNIVHFTPTLKFTHYGATNITINNTFGTLDTRATVGHVTRNIKFISGPDSGWGYTVYVNHMLEQASKSIKFGLAILDSIQFTIGGKYDTQMASLVLNNGMQYQPGRASIVFRSSFSFCRSYCIFGDSHLNTNITSNIFYEARNYHVKARQVSWFYFIGNVMMGAISKFNSMNGREPVACFELTQSRDAFFNSIFVKNNICQGSDIVGFVLNFYNCYYFDFGLHPFTQNTAGSAEVGFLLIESQYQNCQAFSGAKAYACQVGQICSPSSTKQIKFSNFIMADNKRSVTLRFNSQGQDLSAYLKDSYITQISRPTCTQCYELGKIACSGNNAIRMLATSVKGSVYPYNFDSSYDGISKQSSFDCKSFLKNVQFDYYKLSYIEPALSLCSNNVVFKTHPYASDFVGSAYTWNTSCTNCNFNALAYFDPANKQELGLMGGCGNMVCTGKRNYLIQDYTGTLFPSPGALVPNNSWIGLKTPGCTLAREMLGYFCMRNDIGILEYESIAPDYNTRIMWPVTLTPQSGSWKTFTNGFKQRQWYGGQPQNKRLGRFITMIQLQQRYNMSFASNPPDDMRFQIQKRTQTGNSSDWVIIKISYNLANLIQVQANGIVIKPISLLDNNGERPLDTTICGSNKFFYKNYSIHFVVTGVNCIVRITLINSVQLTLRFAINVSDFFKTYGPTRLIDRMCAILQITDQSKVKIVGIYTGSTVIVMTVNGNPDIAPIDDTLLFTAAPQSSQSNITDTQKTAAKINQLYSNGFMQKQLGMGSILSAQTVVIQASTTQEIPESNNNQIIIIAAVVSSVVFVAIIGGVIIFLRFRSRRPRRMRKSRKQQKQQQAAAEQIPAYSSGSKQDKPNTGPATEPIRETIHAQNVTEEEISQQILQVKI